MKGFGEALKKERVAKKITLRELSEYIGKSIGYISDVEHDRKGPPNLEIVRKAEEFLGVRDGKLINLAAKLREKIPKDLTLRIKMVPRLSEALLRADDDLTDGEFDKLMEYMEKMKKRRVG